LTLGFWSELHPTTRRLLLTRAVRSLAQGALAADFALYLLALHWSGVQIGLVLTGGGLFGAGLSLLVGYTSDRLRRKPLVMIYQVIAFAAGLLALVSSQPGLLIAGAVLGGLGRGANGAAGPFSPAEQAWLAEVVDPKRRARVFSLNTAIGFMGMGVGSLLAILPAFLGGILPGALAYRPLFALWSLVALLGIWILAGAEEQYRGRTKVVPDHAARQVRRSENQILLKMIFTNAFNGLAIGLTGPLISYWFALRFGVGPASIAPLLALTFAVTAFSSVATGWLAEQVGVIKAVVWSRLIGLLLLIALPLMPSFWLASLVYLLRSVFNRGSAGARQALAVGLVGEERRGEVTSLNNASFTLPQAIGPSIAGALLDSGQLTLPYYLAALLQGIYLVLYGRVFRAYDPNGRAAQPRTGD
jgi:MFS family permease